jgi:hypothetical protein
VIALHDRQSPALPWTPSARLELAPTGGDRAPLGGTGRYEALAGAS